MSAARGPVTDASVAGRPIASVPASTPSATNLPVAGRAASERVAGHSTVAVKPITAAFRAATTTAPPVHAIAALESGNVTSPQPVSARNPQTIPADEFDRIEWRDPVYPRQALREHTHGWVELEFTVTPDGKVRDIAVVDAQPTGTFERAATEALTGWRFRPRVVNGQAVAQRSSLTMRFDVDD